MAERRGSTSARWPNLPARTIVPTDPASTRGRPSSIRGRSRTASWAASSIAESLGARRDADLRPIRRTADASASVARAGRVCRPEQPASPFVFEVGARYWYSSGQMQLRLRQRQPAVRQSDLDARLARTDRATAARCSRRIDHMPSGVFVKGVLGLGTTIGRPASTTATSWPTSSSSPTRRATSSNGNLSFAMFDVGWAYSPAARMSGSAFSSAIIIGARR